MQHAVGILPPSFGFHYLIGQWAIENDPVPDIEDSDYLGTLLRDPIASHLLETVVSRCPDVAFGVFWNTYFKGKLARLAAHPVANFVLAKAAERSSEGQLAELFEELKDSANKLIRSFFSSASMVSLSPNSRHKRNIQNRCAQGAD